MKTRLFLGALAFTMPVIVFADGGTCADPEPLYSITNDSGTTCGGQAGINLGGTIFVHPSKVYKIHINSNGPHGHQTNIRLFGANREAAIAIDCSSSPLVIGAATMPLDVSTLADGNYLLVVTTDPGMPATDPVTCGDFVVDAAILPVSLQNFSVD